MSGKEASSRAEQFCSRLERKAHDQRAAASTEESRSPAQNKAQLDSPAAFPLPLCSFSVLPERVADLLQIASARLHHRLVLYRRNGLKITRGVRLLSQDLGVSGLAVYSNRIGDIIDDQGL